MRRKREAHSGVTWWRKKCAKAEHLLQKKTRVVLPRFPYIKIRIRSNGIPPGTEATWAYTCTWEHLPLPPDSRCPQCARHKCEILFHLLFQMVKVQKKLLVFFSSGQFSFLKGTFHPFLIRTSVEEGKTSKSGEKVVSLSKSIFASRKKERGGGGEKKGFLAQDSPIP